MIDPKRLEFIKEFLQENCAGREEAWEIANLLEYQALADARPLLQAKKDIAYLLAQDLHDNTILELVTQYATIKLENPTHATASAWLKWLAKQIDRELNENLLPFQPIRAKLERILEPADKKFPHDLLLYPSDEPLPEYWWVVWYRSDVFYKQFLKEWGEETCPACQTLTKKATRPSIQADTWNGGRIVRQPITTNSSFTAVQTASWDGRNRMAQKPLLIQVIHETEYGMAKPRPTLLSRGRGAGFASSRKDSAPKSGSTLWHFPAKSPARR
ncbi:MAG: hypothetical protein CVU44_11825 [Chloroflexi bacterium HGW-Chloroflexi-6]|nr:MAG: hypothetical protein CVU44_11825 [Chloroflexi bacterium HGW-Chloroflexi-6]